MNSQFKPGQWEVIMDMAQCYLWRAEVERWQFVLVVKVLQAIGWLDEMQVEAIHDTLDEIYPDGKQASDPAIPAPPAPKQPQLPIES